MSEYVVTDTELTAVADAIRTKGGTSAQLEFPDDFISAIGDIPSGSGDVDLLTRSEWDALSIAQKQAKGLVAIQDSITGYERGVLVNGADYMPLGIYIPNSDENKVICEAYTSIFDSSESEWGYGANPVQLANDPSVRSDGSILFPANSTSASGYVDLGETNKPFTAYIVAKSLDGSSYRRLISCFYQRTGGSGIMLYGSTVNVSSWANDSPLNIDSTDYFVGVIQYTSNGNAMGAAISASSQTPNFISKPPSRCGRYVAIGRTDDDSSTNNAEPCNMAVKYIAVVSEVESQQVIAANMANLLSEFITSE